MTIPAFLRAKPAAARPSTAAGGGGPAPRRKLLALGMTCQQADFWCWVAVTQTVERYAGNALPQTGIATDHIANSQPGVSCTIGSAADATDRCGTNCSGACNSPHLLSVVLTERGRFIAANNVNPSFSDLSDLLDANTPVPVRIDWGNGGHFICVVGYADDGRGGEFVDVLDPMVPGINGGPASPRQIPFASFVSSYTLNGSTGTPNFYYEVQ